MSMIFNGTTLTDVVFNGTSLDTVIINGTTVFTSGPVQTATPRIHSSSYNAKFQTIQWYVENEDASSATIFSELEDNTPDVSRGVVAGGGSTSTSLISQSTFGGATIYATASKGGTYNNADISNYDSVYQSA